MKRKKSGPDKRTVERPVSKEKSRTRNGKKTDSSEKRIKKADKETQAAKHPKVLVDVKYSAFETTGTTCSFRTKEERGGLQLPRVPVTPETPLGAITLIRPAQSYHQLAKDELMHMLMPQAPLYPNSKFYVPVFLQQPLTDQAPITAFTIKYG